MPRAKKPKKPPVERRNDYYCALCPQDEEGEPQFAGTSAFVAHFREAHPERLNEEGKLMGRQVGVLFLDGSDFYSNQYRLFQGETLIGSLVSAGPRERSRSWD